jgi:hypothetical protein
LLSVEDREQITGPVYLSWFGAQSRNDGRVALHPLRRSSGETHRQQFPLLCHGERATPVLEDNVRWCSIAVAKQDVRARQRGMPTEVNVDFRGEPPQPKLALVRDDKGGISKIVLRRDGLQDLIREPLR